MGNRVKIILQNPQVGVLDVAGDAEVPFSFSFSDIRNITSKNGVISKTIKLAGTKNNNQILNNLFTINTDNLTFDYNKLQTVTVLQDNETLLEEAVMQLLAINKVQAGIEENGLIEYQVIIRDTAADFFTKLSGKKLTDLEFGYLDHNLTAFHIKSTFTNTAEQEYKYFFHHNDSFVNYNIEQFKPAIYAKAYLDKIVDGAGFSYVWDSLSANTIQFNNLLIPYNQDRMKISSTDLELNIVRAYNQQGEEYGEAVLAGTQITGWTEQVDNYDRFNPILGTYDNEILLPAQTGLRFEFTADIDIIVRNNESIPVYLNKNVNSSGLYAGIKYNNYLQIYKTPNAFVTNIDMNLVPDEFTLEAGAEGTFTGATIPANSEIVITGGTRAFSHSLIATSFPNETYLTRAKVQPTIDGPSAYQTRWNTTQAWNSVIADVDAFVRINYLTMVITPNPEFVTYNSIMRMNRCIPPNITQSDFVRSICTAYNLIVIPNPDNPRELVFKTRDNFIDSGIEEDWTNLLNKDKEQSIIPNSAVNKKSIQLTYKQDDNDILLKGYHDTVKETYGQVAYTYDSEHVKGIDRQELIFSPIVAGKDDNLRYLPYFNGTQPKNNIKLALNSKQITLTGVTDLAIWNGENEPDLGIEYCDTYPLISHLSDGDNPDFDINFGINDYYYYILNTVPFNNLFNLHWRRTINQINKGKLFTAYFNLDRNHVKNLNKKIFVRDAWYNINAIIDFKAGKNEPTKVELITIDDDLDVVQFDPYVPAYEVAGDSTFNQLLSDTQLATDTLGFSRPFGFKNQVNEGSNNNLTGEGNFVRGSNNILLSPDSFVIGDNNIVYDGLTSAFIFGNGITADTSYTLFTDNIQLSEGSTINGLTTQILSGATLWSAGTGSDSIQANNPTGTLASGQYALAIGDNNVASGYAAVAEGRATDATGNLSHAGGYFTTTNNYNEWGRGHLIATGPSITGQYGFLNFVERTTNATPTEIFLDSNSQRMSIISGSVYHVAITLLGQNSSGDTYVSKWDGVIKNVSGTTSFVGTPMYSTIAVDTAMTGVTYTVSANNTNDALQIEVTGIASTTINWTATAQYTAIKTN